MFVCKRDIELQVHTGPVDHNTVDYFCPGPANYYLAMVSRGREERGERGGGGKGRAGQVEME